MDKDREARLRRYLLNSDQYFWRLLPGKGQKEIYDYLRDYGQRTWGDFSFSRGAYSSVMVQLLDNPGVEKLVNDLIAPVVRAKFNGRVLDELRSCWMTGERPSPAFLRRHNMFERARKHGQLTDVIDGEPFLEVTRQYQSVEGWTLFAGAWFEEIEHLDD